MNKPWLNEPDSVSFEHAGLRCEMRRGPVGAWCGYVGVDETHPWFGKGYDDIVTGSVPENTTVEDVGFMNAFLNGRNINEEQNTAPISMLVPCHGGLTYAAKGSHIEEDSKLWWFGFDCSHAGDYSPSLNFHSDDVYRDMEFVKSSCMRAAEALSKAKGN